MRPFYKKSSLEFLQGCWFVAHVAHAMRGRLGLFSVDLIGPGGSSSSCSTAPLGIIVPFDSVVSPLQRLKVRQIVASSFCFWHDVVDFPSDRGRDISVVRPTDQVPTNILADDFGTVASRYSRLPPNGGAGGKVEISTVFVCVVCHFCFFAGSPLAAPAKTGAAFGNHRAKHASLNKSASLLDKEVAETVFESNLKSSHRVI